MLQFQGKLETLKQQIDNKPLLKDIVAADKAAKVATVSGRSNNTMTGWVAADLAPTVTASS